LKSVRPKGCDFTRDFGIAKKRFSADQKNLEFLIKIDVFIATSTNKNEAL
jgi:hypothetical protein